MCSTNDCGCQEECEVTGLQTVARLVCSSSTLSFPAAAESPLAGGDAPSSSPSRPFSVFLWSWSNWWQLSMQLNFPHSNIYSSFALPTSAEGRGSLSTFGWWWHAFIQTVDTWFWSLLSSGTINSSTLSGKHSKFCIMVNIIPVPQLQLWTQSLCVPHDFSP